RRQVAARPVFIGHVHRGRGDLRVGRRTLRLDGFGYLELQRPERQGVPVAPPGPHGGVAEVPPSVTLRPGEIHLVERPRRGGTEPEVPVQPRGNRGGARGTFANGDNVVIALSRLFRLPAPGPVDPDVHLAHRTNRAGLDQLDHAPVVVG